MRRELVSGECVAEFVANGFTSVTVSEAVRRQLREVFSAGEAFFGADRLEKMSACLELDSGYRPYGVEYSRTDGKPDEVESFSVSHRAKDSTTRLASERARLLHTRMLTLFDEMEPIVEHMTSRVAEVITRAAPSETFRGSFRRWSLLQLNHSRPAETPVEYINELHEDGCLITVTVVTAPGLELQTADGSFLPISPGEDLLLMSGEIMWLLSGGKIPPIYHHVRTVSSCPDRFSMLFFGDMDPLLCDPWVSNNTNIGVDIGSRILKNSTRFGLSEWKLD